MDRYENPWRPNYEAAAVGLWLLAPRSVARLTSDARRKAMVLGLVYGAAQLLQELAHLGRPDVGLLPALGAEPGPRPGKARKAVRAGGCGLLGRLGCRGWGDSHRTPR